MRPKPASFSQYHASAFQEQSVADAYQARPPYPEAVFDMLANLVTVSPRHVLDVGCGTGFIARNLVGRVDHIDAVDISPVMIEHGRHLPNGDAQSLSWIIGPIETAPLAPPYALITAGDSLHWMKWDVVLPRFAEMLSAHGFLAILGVGQLPAAWDADLLAIIQRYSTIRDYQRVDMVEELVSRGLFEQVGSRTTEPLAFTQSLDAYIESFHGRASFSRERMSVEAAAAFDAEVQALVRRHAPDGVTLQLVTEVVWGTPMTGSQR
jgi:trans-aconitate methyltransferase